jgi:hypothetical protein
VAQHRIVVADVNADAERLICRRATLLAGQRDACAMYDFLHSAGVRATPSADGATIAVHVRNVAAARHIRSALVCFIAAAALRFEADVSVLTAIGEYRGGVNCN